MPFLDSTLRENAIVRRFGNPPGMFFPGMAVRIIEQRKADPKGVTHKDFLSHYLAAQKNSPHSISSDMVINYALNNIVAGSDATAVSLRAIFCSVCSHHSRCPKDKRIYPSLS